MDLILRVDIQRLATDTEKVKEGLEVLKQDHAFWAREGEQEKLTRITERLKRLEADVSMVMIDCFSLSHEKESKEVMEALYKAFVGLNTLFQDLKKVRLGLNEACIHSERPRQVEIDWDRFRKTIGQILEHLREGTNFMKVKNVLPSSKGGKDVCFSTTRY